MDFMNLGWISWIFHGLHGFQVDDHGSKLEKISTNFMDLGWIFVGIHGFRLDFHGYGMDLRWIFHGIHKPRLDFHGSGMDFLRMSWMSG